MTTVTSKTFRSGNSQAVRLPREIAYDDGVELTITRSGDVVTMQPKRPSIAEMFAKLDALPKPSYIEVRDTEEIPERPGL
ncbi:MAG: AbrB/MazE/SpoVT family DNA-binding domain-containing protein [Caulobacter sp.]|nr:AbrB/MazE/SpoVT family DNA-binding domain-containing protein [Caulobacter sp.]